MFENKKQLGKQTPELKILIFVFSLMILPVQMFNASNVSDFLYSGFEIFIYSPFFLFMMIPK